MAFEALAAATTTGFSSLNPGSGSTSSSMACAGRFETIRATGLVGAGTGVVVCVLAKVLPRDARSDLEVRTGTPGLVPGALAATAAVVGFGGLSQPLRNPSKAVVFLENQ